MPPPRRRKLAESGRPQALILAAGTDGLSAPLTRPRALLPVLNRPLLAHLLARLTGLVAEAVIVTGPGERERFEEALGRERGLPPRRFVEADAGQGVAAQVLQAAPLLRGDFFCLDGATLLSREDLRALAGPGSMLVCSTALPGGPRPEPWACRLDTGCLPALERFAADGARTLELPALLRQPGAEVSLRTVTARDPGWRVTYAWDLLTVHEALVRELPKPGVRGRVEKGVTLKGDVHVGKGSVIKSGSYIEGPVLIGEGCEVGPNAYLRHGAVLGNRCKVGHATEVKNSILCEDVEVGSLSIVLDSILGAGVSFGSGCLTANLRLDKARIEVEVDGARVDTGRTKLGVLVGDGAWVPLGSGILEGVRIAPNARVPPAHFVSRDFA